MHTEQVRLDFNPSDGLMHGQISLEFLLIFAIFLTALGVLASAMFNTKSATQLSLSKFISQKTMSDIAYVIDDICVLGPGNKRSTTVSLLAKSILSAEEREITLTSPGESFKRTVKCRVSVTNPKEIQNNVLEIEKTNSTIYITIS